MNARLMIVVSVGSLAFLVSAESSAHGPGKSQLNIPRANDVNPDPDIFETTIVGMEAELDLDGNGLLARVNTYGGTVPGPEIRVKVGDTVILHFENQLAEFSGIHCHGIELNNASDGTAVTQNGVATGETFTYQFIARRPGIFFYHPHFNPTNPVFKGQYGSFIVTSDAEQVLHAEGVLPNQGNTKTLVLSDTTVCKAPGQNDSATFPASDLPWAGGAPFPGNSLDPTPLELCEDPLDSHGGDLGVPLQEGDIPNVQQAEDCQSNPNRPCRTNEGQHVLTNGRIPAPRGGSPDAPGEVPNGAPVYNAKAGEGIRLQLINAATTRYFRLRLTDPDGKQVPLFRVGGEAGLLDHVRLEGGIEDALNTKYDEGEILLAPSDRADVVFVVPEGNQGSIATLWTRDYMRTGMGFANIPTVPVLHVRIVGSGRSRMPFEIAEGDALLTHPAVNAPIHDLKGLATDSLLDPALLPDAPPGSDDDEISFTNSSGPSIDGVVGTFDAAVPDFTMIDHIDSSRFARVDDLLELKLTNATGAHHPLHLHGFSIQPIRMEQPLGTPVRTYDYNEFADTVDIPGGHTLVFRVHLEDRPMADGVTAGGAEGRWLFHCHIFHHATLGMISELVVLPRP